MTLPDPEYNLGEKQGAGSPPERQGLGVEWEKKRRGQITHGVHPETRGRDHVHPEACRPQQGLRGPPNRQAGSGLWVGTSASRVDPP